MIAKRPIPLPTSGRRAAKGALLIAISLLQDERVRAQLRAASASAREWAFERRGAERDATHRLDRFDPTRRFGHKGIERRLAALERNAALVFPDSTDGVGTVIFQAIDELDRAAAISATMPLNERRKARSRINSEVSRLERELVDAVLPPAADATR